MLITLDGYPLDVDAGGRGVPMAERVLRAGDRAGFLDDDAGEAVAGLVQMHVADSGLARTASGS